MAKQSQLVDPFAQQAQAPPPKPALVDPYAPSEPKGISLDKDQAQRATDALVYSHLTGSPASVTYDHRDQLQKDFGERLEGYAAAGWKGLTKDSIIGEYMHGKISGPFESDDEVSKFIEGFGQMIGDLPAYLAGGGIGLVAGGLAGTAELPVVGTISGATVGAGAGGFALTAGLRQWLVDKYAGKKISAFDEVMDIVKSSAKGALTGVAFGVAGEAAPLAGGVVGRFLGARAYKTAAELATMTTVGSALEGKIPTAGDFASNAALLALMHVTVGNIPFAKRSASDLEKKSMDLYAKGNVHPDDLVSEASRRSVNEPPSDNPMEILNKIDNELRGIPGKTPEAAAETVTPKTDVAPDVAKEDTTGTLRPALREGDKIEAGAAGETHSDIMDKGKTGEHGFVDPQGNFLDRKQAEEWVAKNEPEVAKKLKPSEDGLHTENYNDANKQLSETGIKNAVTKAERADRGLSEVEVEARQVPAFEAGKKAVDEGKIDARALAEELSKNPRPHTDEEAAALLYDRMRLQNEHATAMNTIEQARATGDEVAEARGKAQLAKIEDATNKNDEAARKSGTETGRALAARRMMIREDYSLANVLQRARAASANGEVSPEVRNSLESLTRQLDEANKRIDAYEESKKQQAAARTVEKLKGDHERSVRSGRRVAAKADLKIEYDSLIKNLNAELMGQLSANPMLNPKLYDLFGKLAVNRIQAGYLTIEQIVDDLHASLQERGISKREIRDYISQYGKKIELSKDEINVRLREARRQGRLLSALEDAQNKELPLRSGLQRDAQSERVKELTKQVNEAMKDAGLKPESNKSPEEQWKSNLARYKTTLENKIKTLQKQLDTGDFTKPTRGQTVLDSQAQDLKAQVEKLKGQVDEAIHKQKLAARTPVEKGAALFQKWRRAVLLSSVNTVGKLTTAAMMRFGTTPMEELIGGVLSKMPGLSAIAEKAPREGAGLNISAEAKAFGQIFEKATYQDVREVLKTGKSSLDYIYGKKSTLPPEALDFFGHMHGALKIIPKRAEFFRSLEKRAQWALDNHLDIQDPKVQATMAADAYIDANRAIFMQENFINTGFKILMNYFQSQGLSGKSTEFMLRTVLPIVKVPTNIVAETGTVAFGSVTGSIDALRVLVTKDGLKNLTGHEADNILRSMKKGSIGLAVLGLGYYAGHSAGFIQATGFYKPGDKKSETLTIGGIEVPPWIQHTPVGMVFEMGATLRRVNDAYTIKGKSGGFVAGATTAGLGTIKKVPFLEEATRLAEATRSSESAGLFIDDLIQSFLIPPDVRRVARMGDKNEAGEPVKRRPTNLRESLEQNIPGMRENVPKKRDKGKSKFTIRSGKAW